MGAMTETSWYFAFHTTSFVELRNNR